MALGEPVRAASSGLLDAQPSISVQGFRGIGAGVALHLQAGPGLTVVTGRNRSGKSSFAEAAEIALTGDNMRWSERTAVWKEGWRNLHQPDPAVIEVKLAEDGQPAPTVWARICGWPVVTAGNMKGLRRASFWPAVAVPERSSDRKSKSIGPNGRVLRPSPAFPHDDAQEASGQLPPDYGS